MAKRSIIDELLKERLSGPSFTPSEVCFDEQLRFIQDPSKLKTAVCGRRAGKTYACASYLLHTALTIPSSTSLYITLTRTNAKRILWPTLLELTHRTDVEVRPNETELSIICSNGSRIFLLGANDREQIEKFRGFGLALCIVDEAQSFKEYLEGMIEDVISKALYDYDGTLALIGTPGPVPVGYFYRVAQSTAYAHHCWTMFNNPHLIKKSGKSVQELIDQDLKRSGRTINDPTIRREVFAEWVTDSNALVFQYNQLLNDYTVGSAGYEAPTQFVIGVDIGFDDSDAIAVLGWSDNSPSIYLVEEYIKSGQTVTELADIVDKFIKKYNPLRVVMDVGGLGKKLAEELRKRYALPIQAAEKSRKFEYIELLNDALRMGRLRCKATSQFAQDSYLVEWDRSKPQKLAISTRFHSDITDAVLYAYREALHWLYSPKEEKVEVKTRQQWMRHSEKLMQDNLAEQIEKQEADEREALFEATIGMEPDEVLSYHINKRK